MSKISEQSVTSSIILPNEVFMMQVDGLIKEGKSVTFNVKGYSMRPFLEHLRDKVVLEHCETPSVGDAVLVRTMQGPFVLHRIISLDGDIITLMGDGNLRGKETCRKCDVIGVVRKYVRNGKVIDADNAMLCKCIRLWGKMLPIRRFLLLAYRVNLKLKNILK